VIALTIASVQIRTAYPSPNPSGKLLAVWTAIFVNKSESNDLWAECAEALKAARVENLYNGVVHFRDRHTGCAVFEEKLQISRGMYCVPHILRNILQHKVRFGP
jgi:hypothetical protein